MSRTVNIPMEVWEQMTKDINAIKTLMADIQKAQAEDRNSIYDNKTELERLSRGFVDNDPEAHMREHRASQDMRQLRIDIAKEAIKKSAAAGLIWGMYYLGMALWEAIKIEFRK